MMAACGRAAAPVDVVGIWTGQQACLLRTAYRLTSESFAIKLGIAPRTVSKWESRPDIIPVPLLQEVLDTALEQAHEAVRARFFLLSQSLRPGTASPAHPGAGEAPGTAAVHEPVPPADAAEIEGQFLALAGAAVIGALGDRPLAALAASGPATLSHVGQADVADLQRVIDGMEHADHAAGGRTVVRSLALEHLKWARKSLQTASFSGPSARAAWMGAIARLGRLAGFMSVDARDHDTARRCFLVALQVAAIAEDWPGRLNVLSGMARQAVHVGDGSTALKIATLARAGEETASATTRAMMRVLEARAYGVLGRAGDAVSAVRQAEDLFASRQPDDDPPWLWFYDDAQLLGDTGHALFPLALAGVEVDAVRRLRQAVMTHTAADARGRTFSLIKLATLESCENPGPEAWATAREAVAAATGLRSGRDSGRALDYLGDLARVLRQSPVDEAADLAREADATANGTCAA